MKLFSRILRAVWQSLSIQTKIRIFRAAGHDLPYQTRLTAGIIDDHAILLNLRSLGFAPDYVLDIGAYHGLWTKRVKEIFPSARFLLFEAQADKKGAIIANLSETDNWELFTGVLGRTEGLPVQFYLMETGSSYYEEATPFPRKVVECITTTLDALVQDTFLSGKIVYVKMDTQGSELDILHGGTSILRSATFISIETNIFPYNRDAPTTHKVIEYMARQGFIPFDIIELHRRSYDHTLLTMDVLFIRESSELFASLGDFSKGI